MAERIKDAQDRLLESMFQSNPVADDGFSVKVVGRVKRRLWLRRVTLPTAAAIGVAVSAKPLSGLVAALSSLASLFPQEILGSVTGAVPQIQTVVLGAMILAVCLLGVRSLAD